MSSELTVRVDDLPDLSPEQKEKVKRYIRNGMTSHLSADKEVGPFMLYMMGYSLEAVAKASGFPFDVICLTAAHSRWAEKRNLLQTGGPNVAMEMQKNIANMMLVATFLASQQELADVLSGKKEAIKSHLAVKSLSGLQNLVDIVMKLNGMVDPNGNPVAPPGTVIHAQNVQINNNSSPEEVKSAEEKKLAAAKERAEKLKALADGQEGI